MIQNMSCFFFFLFIPPFFTSLLVSLLQGKKRGDFFLTSCAKAGDHAVSIATRSTRRDCITYCVHLLLACR